MFCIAVRKSIGICTSCKDKIELRGKMDEINGNSGRSGQTVRESAVIREKLMGCRDEVMNKLKRIEKSRTYAIRDEIKIMMDEKAPATSVAVRSC